MFREDSTCSSVQVRAAGTDGQSPWRWPLGAELGCSTATTGICPEKVTEQALVRTG